MRAVPMRKEERRGSFYMIKPIFLLGICSGHLAPEVGANGWEIQFDPFGCGWEMQSLNLLWRSNRLDEFMCVTQIGDVECSKWMGNVKWMGDVKWMGNDVHFVERFWQVKST